MAHLLIAAPPTHRWQLWDRFAELALRRGHRVCVLAGDPVAAAFFHAQALPVRELPAAGAGRPAELGPLPLEELAHIDARLSGRAHAGRVRTWRVGRRLAAEAAGLLRLFDADPPDVVVFHNGRSARHRLIHFLATERGCRVLHTGDGFLPGTIQVDGEGVDGDSSACRRTSTFYRRARHEPGLLASALTAWLGGAGAPPVARRSTALPRRGEVLFAMLRAMLRDGVARGWQAARFALPRPAGSVRLLDPALPPAEPFVLVLLQHPSSPELLLDGPVGVRSLDLLAAVRAAARELDPRLRVAAMLPPGPDARAQAARLRRRAPEVATVPADAHAALAAAAAVVTVTHPAGYAALLAGTPLVHLGRAVYAVPGVATHATLAGLDARLQAALSGADSVLRGRFLSWTLRRDLLWCNADAPDRNGLNGLLDRVERCLARPAGGGRLYYRPGPGWPLSTWS